MPRTTKLAFAAACLAALFLSFYGVGCTRRNAARPGTLAMWERQLGLKPRAIETQTMAEPKRRIADNSAPRCWKDRMTPAMLRADIARLEAERGGSRVSGNWRGIDLSTLPPSQAQFLKI